MSTMYEALLKRETSLEKQTSSMVTADVVYILFCSFGVFLITPGIAMYYMGFMKRKNIVQVLFQSYMTTAVVVILWYLIGYSIANSPSSSSTMYGDLAHAALHNEEAKPLLEDGSIPSVVNFCFNVFFPVATAQIFLGAIGERGRVLPSQIIGILFTIAVYSPQAFWTWSGWLYNLGALDFAGGGPVHISSGVASLVYSFYLGPRGHPEVKIGKVPHYKGHSALTTFIGVTLIWGAWFCFNSGTLLAVNTRTGYIFLNTILASSFASVTYVILDKLITGKYSLMAACDGVIVGLVNITPSCGFYPPWAAAITSIINASICRSLGNFNQWVGIDDSSHSFVVHGVGGIIGSTLTGIFASKTIAGYDGVTDIEGGWINGHFVQLGHQIAAWTSIVIWTAVFTYIIIFIVDHIPGCKVTADADAQEMGMDLYEMSETLDEFGNNYDEFFSSYAHRLREIADAIDHHKNRHGTIEVLEGTSPNGSNSIHSVNVHYEQKV